MRADSAVEPKSENITRHLATFGTVFWMCAWRARCGRCINRGQLTARIAAQSSDGIHQFHTVPKRGNTKLLQVLLRQARENHLVYPQDHEGGSSSR
jgi:hypothetical protein